MTPDRLIIGLPSKGRLHLPALEFLKAAGLPVRVQGGRGYAGSLPVDNAVVAFLPAAGVARALEAGSVHLGLTGADLLRESINEPEKVVEFLTPPGFGRADVVAAVPRGWIDVHTMADLADVARDFRDRHNRALRVATKYPRLTRRFFADHAVIDYRIVESPGATEGSPAAGTAEIVVDITDTGATLAANNLKVPSDGVLLGSEAWIVKSLTASWTPPVREAAAHVMDMITACRRAASLVEVRFAAAPDDGDLLAMLESEFGCSVPFGSGGIQTVHCPVERLQAVSVFLRGRGKTVLTASRADYIFDSGSDPASVPAKKGPR